MFIYTSEITQLKSSSRCVSHPEHDLGIYCSIITLSTTFTKPYIKIEDELVFAEFALLYIPIQLLLYCQHVTDHVTIIPLSSSGGDGLVLLI